MLTTRAAARLLASPDDIDQTTAIAGALGCRELLTLGRRELRRLGLEASDARARVGAREDGLRVLTLEIAGGDPLHHRLPALVRALASDSGSIDWLVVARDRPRRAAAIAIGGAGPRAPLSALVIDTADVRAADAESLALLAATSEPSALLTAMRWREILGRDALTRRFYRELEGAVTRLASTAQGPAGARERRTLALLNASRLLFLSFLESRGWLDGDAAFLRREFARGPGAHRRFLIPLFFGTLNTRPARRAARARAFGRVPFLNGGLFTPTPIERRHRGLTFADDALGELIGGVLARYRLSPRERVNDTFDIAVDPEMLGRAFESLMHPAERKARGTFYTPHPIVDAMVTRALDEAVREDGTVPDAIRVLDPACGSGAFLVRVLERLTERSAADGDERPITTRRREVLTRSIFGVDIDPTAVWLCQLRLWLSVVVDDPVDDPTRVLPLPNLDRNVREGDALAGDAFDIAGVRPPTGGRARALEQLRIRYARATGARKRTLGRALDRAERERACEGLLRRIAAHAVRRRDLLGVVRGPDLFATRGTPDAQQRRELDRLRAAARADRTALARLRGGGAIPFDFATHFAEVAPHGFDLVIGNPPWVRPHAMAPAERERLRGRFVTLRAAAWRAGADAAAAGRGFASQGDLAAPFVERADGLLRAGGVLAFLLPAKLWRSLAGGGVREYLLRRAPPLLLEEHGDGSTSFDAAVYPSTLLARKATSALEPACRVRLAVHRARGVARWEVERGTLPFDDTPGAPWIMLPTGVRAAFEALRRAGVPLAQSPLGRPLLGVKCGCNEAFIAPRRELESVVEGSLLRPLLRGEQLRAWRLGPSHDAESIIWTHDMKGEPLRVLPPAAQRRLHPWRRHLEQRADGRGARWWSLFRIESARSDRARVVWGDIGRTPRALVLRAGDPTVPLNTCYVVRAPNEDDAHALAALLNSRVLGAWLGALAEPARGGYLRFLGWTCALLPVPRDWTRGVRMLAPFGRAAVETARDADAMDERALDALVCDAFGVRYGDVEPLVRWAAP